MRLAGQYLLHPGSRPGIGGSRPVMGGAHIGRLLLGQQGESVARTLGHLFTLCAHAHRRTARLALAAAARQADAPVAPQASRALELETARDHLRSMALDWPRRHVGAPPEPAWLGWLARCPLPLAPPAGGLQAAQVATQHAQLRAWLESTLLRMPLALWLAHYRDADACAAWYQDAATRAKPLQCLAGWHAIATDLRPATRTLDVLDADAPRQAAHLSALARDLRADPDFALRPLWQGTCAESGAWCRLRHRHPAGRTHSAWSRLHARWVELLELAQGPADPRMRLLDSGALPLGGGQAIAWCEMARGLLLHWVRLDDQQRVQDYRVLAPTEWNFHPDGALAHAVSGLTPQDRAGAACLAVAYDPCVDCGIVVQESSHA